MNDKVKGFQDLSVWHKSMDLVESIYQLVKKLPPEERYILSDQLRRAVVSIPSNIAEGSGRNGTKEYVQFLYIALGSACEVETQLLIVKRIGYNLDVDAHLESVDEIKRMLNGLISSLKRSF